MPTLAIGQAQLPVDQVHANPNQPRKQFDPEAQKALERSLKQRGLINPISVVQRPEGGYSLIAGERRLRAAQELRWKSIDARIWPAHTPESEVEKLSVVENLQREDLNPMEEALSFKNLIEKQGMSQREVAKMVGRPQSAVGLFLMLLDQPERIQDLISREIILTAHMRFLGRISDINERLAWAEKVVENGWSSRELERQIRDHLRAKNAGNAIEGVPSEASLGAIGGEGEQVGTAALSPELQGSITPVDSPLQTAEVQQPPQQIAPAAEPVKADPLAAFWSAAQEMAPAGVTLGTTFAQDRGWKLAVEVATADERQTRSTLANWLAAFAQRLRPEVLATSAPGPAAPKILEATYVNGHRLQLRWTSSGEGVTYRLYRAPEDTAQFDRLGDQDLRSPGAVVDCWADCYQWYRLAVMAVDPAGHESPLSETIRFDMSGLNNQNAVEPCKGLKTY